MRARRRQSNGRAVQLREARVRRDHPLRAIWTILNEALTALEREFAALYWPIGRLSIPNIRSRSRVFDYIAHETRRQ